MRSGKTKQMLDIIREQYAPHAIRFRTRKDGSILVWSAENRGGRTLIFTHNADKLREELKALSEPPKENHRRGTESLSGEYGYPEEKPEPPKEKE